jgi:hypothetical protein
MNTFITLIIVLVSIFIIVGCAYSKTVATAENS